MIRARYYVVISMVVAMATAAKVAVGVTVTVTANYILVSDGGTHTVLITM